MAWQFETTCVNSTAALIGDLIESEREISYRTFRAALGAEELDRWAESMSYETGPGGGRCRGLHLRNDWHVSYYRGLYDLKPALFIRHSAIEHIWTDDEAGL